jgi:hypothetical protein
MQKKEKIASTGMNLLVDITQIVPQDSSVNNKKPHQLMDPT